MSNDLGVRALTESEIQMITLEFGPEISTVLDKALTSKEAGALEGAAHDLAAAVCAEDGALMKRIIGLATGANVSEVERLSLFQKVTILLRIASVTFPDMTPGDVAVAIGRSVVMAGAPFSASIAKSGKH